MSFQTYSLHQLGWRFNHAQHLTLTDFEAGYPARVIAMHGSGLSVFSSRGRSVVALPHHLAGADVTVGDWVLVGHDADQVMRMIERQSLINGMASRIEHRRQPIAANLDTLFIVASCIDDLHPTRLKRYLMLALEAGVEPVVVLTTYDLTADVDDYVAAGRKVLPTVDVVAVNATDAASIAQLAPWLEAGRTVALVGVSGVGKSMLAHGLKDEMDIRDRRMGAAHEMFPSIFGAWIINTPDARALRMVSAATFGEPSPTSDSDASVGALVPAVLGKG
jgi:ribosome biogenesis GTPase